jgi:hypothetical protein
LNPFWVKSIQKNEKITVSTKFDPPDPYFFRVLKNMRRESQHSLLSGVDCQSALEPWIPGFFEGTNQVIWLSELPESISFTNGFSLLVDATNKGLSNFVNTFFRDSCG